VPLCTKKNNICNSKTARVTTGCATLSAAAAPLDAQLPTRTHATTLQDCSGGAGVVAAKGAGTPWVPLRTILQLLNSTRHNRLRYIKRRCCTS